MPEQGPSARHLWAVELLAEHLDGLGAARLTAPQLGGYAARRAVAGWRLTVGFSDGVARRLDVLVTRGFPRSAAIVALVDRPEFLEWPHLEPDGALCLLNGASEVSPFAPVAAVDALLGQACDLVEDLIAGRLNGDFLAEFLSYWDWAKSNGAIPVRSLADPRGPSRIVRIWRGRDEYLVAETDEALMAWLKAVRPSTKVQRSDCESALLIWRNAALTPDEYPRSGRALAALADEDAAKLLREMAAKQPDRLVSLIGFQTSHGVAFGAVTLRAPIAPRGGGARSRPLEAGFRPGRTPPELVATRYFAGAAVTRASVERVDPSWVHGRDQDPRQARLASARVTVLGCGSVGAPLALLLAEAGVRFVRLVDPQRLAAANLGRHPLGARHLGRFKAAALAEEIRARLPHVRAEAHNCRWEDLPAGAELFDDTDLVISAIGGWAAEGALNAAHLAAGRGVPVLYGWTEPHACAGQGVLVGRAGGCLQCGLDALGGSKLQVTNWPESSGLRQEPACGAVFQPYGPVELNHIVSTLGDLALEALLGAAIGGERRVWVVGERRLRDAGGDWAPAWCETGLAPPSGGAVFELTWAVDADCPECGRDAVAA